MKTCEDYPCCGHELGDCDGSKYGSDESIKGDPHLLCDPQHRDMRGVGSAARRRRGGVQAQRARVRGRRVRVLRGAPMTVTLTDTVYDGASLTCETYNIAEELLESLVEPPEDVVAAAYDLERAVRRGDYPGEFAVFLGLRVEVQ